MAPGASARASSSLPGHYKVADKKIIWTETDVEAQADVLSYFYLKFSEALDQATT